MRIWRFALQITLLSLPCFVALGLGAFFLFNEVPRLVENEHERVRLAYRCEALEIKNNPSAYERKKRTSKWRIAGKMAPGRWGFAAGSEPGRMTVWYGEGDDVGCTEVEEITPRNYFLICWVIGPSVLFIIVLLEFFCIRYFLDYVLTREDFLAATAHDLATPLAGLRYALKVNRQDAPVIVERMTRLVENLKEFLRLGGRKPPPCLETFDITEAFASAYALFRDDYEAEESGAVELSGESSVMVMADRTLVEQIFWNLLGNELKYAAPYSKVRVSFSVSGTSAIAEVSDEGPGMTRRQMRKAFDRYYRAKTVMQSGKGGFGIGLCNSYEAAVSMNGSLSVRANVPCGCIFTLRLPLA